MPTKNRSRLGLSAIAILTGAIAATGQAPLSVFWLSIPAFGGAFLMFLRAADWNRAAFVGWFVGLGYFVVSLNWIVEPFLVDIGRHGWMAPFAILFLSGGLALFWAVAFGLAKGLQGPAGSFIWPATIWCVALTFAEAFRSIVLTGFPWALIGHTLIETPLAQLAAVGGPHLLTLIVLITGSLLAGLVWGGALPRALAVLALLTSLALGWAIGERLDETPTVYAADAPVLRLIQPNAPQHLKWRRDMIPVFYRRSLELTASPADVQPDIVIWPETSVPVLLNNADPILPQITQAAGGAAVAVGMQRRSDNGPHNSLVLLEPDGSVSDIYDKHHLVPFGEYIPFMRDIAALGWQGVADTIGTGYAPGNGTRLMSFQKGGMFQPLICYEAIFPHEVGATVDRPDWLLQVTNDAWFGEFAGPQQHLAQARLRSIENRLPLVRVANTGVSAVIDPFGRVVANLPLGEAGFLDARLPSQLQASIYSRIGSWPLVSLLFLGMIVAAIRSNRLQR